MNIAASAGLGHNPGMDIMTPFTATSAWRRDRDEYLETIINDLDTPARIYLEHLTEHVVVQGITVEKVGAMFYGMIIVSKDDAALLRLLNIHCYARDELEANSLGMLSRMLRLV